MKYLCIKIRYFMKYLNLVLVLSIALLLSCKSTEEKPLTKSSPFIHGLTHIKETTTRTADSSFKYIPHFPDTVLSPFELEYMIDLDLCYEKAYYDLKGEQITGYLPINIDYEFDHSLLLGKQNDNDLIFGEYDFNDDNVNEIVIGFRDNNGSSMGLQVNVIRYVPPPKTETVFCDYWVTLKDIHIPKISPDTYVQLKGNKLIIQNSKSVIETFVFDKKLFDKSLEVED